MASKYNPNGTLLWEGPSLYDGEPVFVVLTGIKGSSANDKTGDLLQTFILKQNGKPAEHINAGTDLSICGPCPFISGNGCYVAATPWKGGANSVYKAYKNNRYEPFNSSIGEKIRGRKIRFGAYGDPAAVPVSVWANLTKLASGFTGYTHGWKDNPDLAPYCMASVHSLAEAKQAQALGYRTFRTVPTEDNAVAKKMLFTNEIICPEATHDTQCASCMLCGGASKQAKNIIIPVHGATRNKASEVSI